MKELKKQPPGVFYWKGVLKSFAKFTGKHLYQSVFFNKFVYLRLATLSKRDSGTGVFRWIYEIFKNIFYSEHDLMGSRVNNISEPFLKKKNISFCLDELVFKAHIQTIILVLFLITK